MPFQHVNRKGDTYYLHAGTGRTGKPRYWFSRQTGDDVLEEVPSGYEVFENPESGQVLLRKKKPTRITAAEQEMVARAVRTLARLEYSLVDIQGDSLVIYTPTLGGREADRVLEGLGISSSRRESARKLLLEQSALCKMMRFTLVDPEARLFRVERWCFRGSIDDWYLLDICKPLPEVVSKYIPHLADESFFNLM